MNGQSNQIYLYYDKNTINPFDLGSLRMILDPSHSCFSDTSFTTKASLNGSCAGLQDGSGNGFSFTQSLADNKPIFKSGGRNNNNYLDFYYGASGNSFMSCTSRSALKSLHDGTGGSIYIVAEVPISTGNLGPGVIISSNALLDTNVGFSITTDLSLDSITLYSRFEITNGTTKIGQTQSHFLSNEFRVISVRTASASTPDIHMRADADFGFSPIDLNALELISEANYTGTPSNANAGADITIGEVGVDTGGYCIMKFYMAIAYDEYLSDYNHDRLLQYFKVRFDLPEYTIV